MTRTRRTARTTAATALLLTVSATATAWGATPTIARIAPPDTIAVIAVDDFTAMREAFDASFLGALWRDPQMQGWIDRMLHEGGIADDFTEHGPGELLDKALERADMERDEITPPTGAAGAALWWGEDTDTGEIGPRWVVVLDFGAGGEKMRALYESAIEEIEAENRDISITDDDYEGADTWRIDLAPEDHADNNNDNDNNEDDAAPDEDDWEDWDAEPAAPPIDHAHVAWINDTMIVAGDRGALERAVNRINGEDMDTLADGDGYANARRQHPGAQIYAAGFVAPMLEAWAPDEAMLGFDIKPVLDTLGVMGLRSMSAGVRFDGAGGALEQTYSVVAPEKKGLVALFDNKMDAFTPPSFVSADAHTVYLLSFDWSGVMPLVNQLVNAFPENERMQAQMMLGALAGGVGPLLDGMRPETVVVQSIRRPFSADSKRMFAAFGVRNNDAISAGLTAMSPMLGFEPRDFLGNQIWDSELGAALGLGFGRLFAGPTEQVEDAMRQAAHDNAASLADDDDFRRATATLRGGAMLYSYQNNRQSYQHTVWMMENLESILRKQFAELDFDDETIEEIIDEQTASNPFAKVGMPPEELLFRHMGDTAVLEAHSTSEGFSGRALVFPAANRD
jgi:hypothetical protein